MHSNSRSHSTKTTPSLDACNPNMLTLSEFVARVCTYCWATLPFTPSEGCLYTKMCLLQSLMTAKDRFGAQVLNLRSLFEAWTYPRALKVPTWFHDSKRAGCGCHINASISCLRQKNGGSLATAGAVNRSWWPPSPYCVQKDEEQRLTEIK